MVRTIPANHANASDIFSEFQLFLKVPGMERLHGLEDWIDYAKVKSECERIGLASFVNAVQKDKVANTDIEAAFIKRFERLWLDAVMPELPTVESFRTRQQEDVIKEFRQLDVEQMQIAKQRINEILRSKLPNINSFISSRDEVGILMREMGKQRKIMPVRKIFDSIPNLMPILKPCMMMSPLSVSQFLQSDNYVFDMVIFDEASQVKTENAIGAISRGKQIIIAGDIHQLPPTNFFATTISGSDEYDEDEEDDSEAFESVLDETNTILPQLTLKWHYRSKNESLIAFSNSKIYNNALVTFPSPSEELTSEGIEFIYVPDGIYYRSSKRNNPVEAKKVADVVFDQIRQYPNRSMGVITFSEAQQRCVENEIIARRLKQPEFDPFFSEEREESFFIKNLENVQGDERDTIIFSVGYGKANPMEELHMGFGPLSTGGGYRRLNVAITRAKYSIKLVASILPTDMRVTDDTPKGVRMLRDYLEFAQNGVKSLENELKYADNAEAESPFEEAVYDFLVRHGFGVTRQVGCSGYRIDMAIKHPTLHGRFVLGIECDGATYHASRTARERDRLRQFVLESMGWKFHRIWSTDWIKDPITEGEKLINAVKKAITDYEFVSPPTMNEKKEQDKRNEDYCDVIEKAPDEAEVNFGFTEYKEKHLSKSYEAPYMMIVKTLGDIVQTQSPVHLDVAYRQLAPLYGKEKVTQRVKDDVNKILVTYQSRYHWRMKGEFIWISEASIKPRYNTDFDKRTLDQIAIEELGEAMKIIIDKSYGIDSSALFRILARAYGFGRVSAAMESRLQQAFDKLKENKSVQEIEGKLKL